MNASPTERTFGAGRLEDLAAGKAWGSETNLLCKVSRSGMNCLRTSRAASWLGAAPSCALSIEGHAATSSPIAASASRLFIGFSWEGRTGEGWDRRRPARAPRDDRRLPGDEAELYQPPRPFSLSCA